MNKKAYIMPLMGVSRFDFNDYCAGQNSIPYGEGDGPGIAEGKERQDKEEPDNDWGSLW
ncbi:MAG: hypothetical protein IKG96_03945 [Bacteroidaceae bacterium]|nr:hypothetical protein [Bacteroidaceae bacterium]